MSKQGRIWVFCDGSAGNNEMQGGVSGTILRAQRIPGASLAAGTHPIPGAPAAKGGQPSSSTPARKGVPYRKPVAACGAATVARSEDGQIVDWAWQALPPMTNNEAEYAGLLLGLGLAQRLHAQETICVLDSDVVVGQMVGRFAVRSAKLRSWHWKACAAVRQLPIVHFRAVPREWNQLADALASQACVPWELLREVVGSPESRSPESGSPQSRVG